ncbi:Rieske (2Fe-2S) protein [Aquabacterium sp. OR-4]|uniref:Rieske (2Fe-2S) protein n=1 Tax=Aquabacterium sp. OR-4 TaxID=2978127 RepID=UPI0028C96AB5|nr:Rieske 2Fe-2S domain-containing protein [Aquabacterium sp. OR-4]MDT7834550.1 Rieske 2Fe-2S domain-containing protein [Aquabacterium sp. OR-4]
MPLCPSSALAERGRAFVWDVLLWGQPARAFALRIDGRVVAYINRCVHVPTEMDWQPGEFLDADKRFILCSIHGAAYAPEDGRCVGGPCGRGRLKPVTVAEQGGMACWYPSADIRPSPAAGGGSTALHPPTPFAAPAAADPEP